MQVIRQQLDTRTPSSAGDSIITRYITGTAGAKVGFGGTLINLDQSKSFPSVSHSYLGAILKIVDYGAVFQRLDCLNIQLYLFRGQSKQPPIGIV